MEVCSSSKVGSVDVSRSFLSYMWEFFTRFFFLAWSEGERKKNGRLEWEERKKIVYGDRFFLMSSRQNTNPLESFALLYRSLGEILLYIVNWKINHKTIFFPSTVTSAQYRQCYRFFRAFQILFSRFYPLCMAGNVFFFSRGEQNLFSQSIARLSFVSCWWRCFYFFSVFRGWLDWK